MSAGVFHRVLVPVELESLEEEEAEVDRSLAVGDHEWIGVGAYTIEAIELACRLVGDGELWLVHAHHDFAQYATWMTPSWMRELDSGARRHSTAVLEAVAARHCAGVDLHCVVRPGRPLDVILDVAGEHPPDAVVLAASSRGKVNRAFVGSTADKVIRRASCPVIVVPSGTA